MVKKFSCRKRGDFGKYVNLLIISFTNELIGGVTMKKITAFLLFVAIILSASGTISAYTNPKLSDLNEDEIAAFLEDTGISIPETEDTGIAWSTFIRYVICEVEKNPDATFHFGYPTANVFAYQIKAAVNEHYRVVGGISPAAVEIVEELRDNTLAGDRNVDYSNYNCMGFAIEDHKWWIPGKIAWSKTDQLTPFYYDWRMSAYDVANLVKIKGITGYFNKIEYIVEKYSDLEKSTVPFNAAILISNPDFENKQEING
jgi:hypothetical protein